MRRKFTSRILCLFFLVSGALALYSECSQAATYHDFGAEHEAPSIHCPDILLHSNIQAASTIQSHRKNFSEIPPGVDEKTDRVVLVARFNDHPFREPFSQQGLFRLEEVFRL